MTDETIVAVYDNAADAEAAVAELRSVGVPESAISVHTDIAETSGVTASAATPPVREQGFWSNLFGGEPEHSTDAYERSLAGGATVVSIRDAGVHLASVLRVLERHNPVDIDERAEGARLNGASTEKPASADDRLQLSEESLAVGKRVVNRGSTRVRRFVVETPVEQSVTLHDETVTLERRPVTDGRPVTDAAFTELTVETAEEAVVSKSAHVYEEVALRRDSRERVETIRDTVRKEEVEVETVPAANTPKLDRPASQI